MSGNVILLKHAPGVPQCAVAFEQILHHASVPEGLHTNLFLSNDQAGFNAPMLVFISGCILAPPKM